MTPLPPTFTLDGLVSRAAREDPDRPAIVAHDESLSYAELDAAVEGVAVALRERGVEPGDRVAIWATKSWRAVAAAYGTMRAGAAYVPIDPHAPAARGRKVLASAECRVLCAERARLDRLEPELQTLDLTPGAGGRNDFYEATPPDRQAPELACETDLAYILYTSGSTGTPKGVMLTHRNALSFVEWVVGRFAVGADDQVVSHAPLHFDLSIFDVYGAAMAAATLHILEPGEESMGADMAAAIRSRGLSVWYSVPSALALLCASASREDLTSLRTVLFAGEVFPKKHLRRLRELAPQATLANLYGPTETNVVTYFAAEDELPPGDAPLPIGRACENAAVMALDDELRPVGEGEVGELWARGPTVMKGYWGRPEDTQERLRQNPLHDLYPDPAYRTGDLVRVLSGGDYEFIGRRDHQVKSRGYRIELGDIETTLNALDSVSEAAVVAVPDERIGSRLVAFVSGHPDLDETDMRRHCAQALPRYMVPGAIVIEDSLPHTSTGKIDRQELTRRAERQASPRR